MRRFDTIPKARARFLTHVEEWEQEQRFHRVQYALYAGALILLAAGLIVWALS